MIGGSRFRSYPETKDSGVVWLGRIPAHWNTRHLKDVGALIAGSGFPHEYQGVWGEELQFYKVGDLTASSDGVRMLDAPNSISRETAKELRAAEIPPGALLWAKIGAALFLNRRRITTRPCCIDNNMTAYIPDPRIVRTDWAFYWTSTLDFGELANPGAVPSLSEGYQATLPVVVLPSDEQQAIAAFLDRETAKIDALVQKKERLIELLQEKRTALITHAVTKGLDPSVLMKESGIEWLGQIPAHWQVKRLWHLTPSDRRIMYGIVLPGPNVEHGVPIVKGGDVSPERLRLDLLNRTAAEIEAGYVRSRLRGGDLVYAIRGSIGEVAIVPDELEGANLTQDAARVAYSPATHGPWLLYALQSVAVFAQLEAGALGATIRGVNIRDLKRASVPVPARVEQEAIAAFLERETVKIDCLIAKVQEAVDRLREYRTALVSAAVTGKIDVRGV